LKIHLKAKSINFSINEPKVMSNKSMNVSHPLYLWQETVALVIYFARRKLQKQTNFFLSIFKAKLRASGPTDREVVRK
jgi:hypothetical protein